MKYHDTNQTNHSKYSNYLSDLKKLDQSDPNLVKNIDSLNAQYDIYPNKSYHSGSSSGHESDNHVVNYGTNHRLNNRFIGYLPVSH